MYRRASRLFDEMRLARADGTYARRLGRVAKIDVLVLDDFAIAPLTDGERRDLLEILEDRHATRSTIITSQLPPKEWHDYLADPTLADAICDRLVHQAHRIVLKGPSRRKEPNIQELTRPASLRSDHDARNGRSRWRETPDHDARNAQTGEVWDAER